MQGYYIKVKCLYFNKDIVNQDKKKIIQMIRKHFLSVKALKA